MAMWGGGGAAGWSTNLGGGRGGMGGGTGRGGDGWDDDYLGKVYDAAVVKRFGPRPTMVLGLVGGAIGFLVQGLATTPPFYIAGVLVMSVWGFLNPALQASMTRLVHSTEQGQLQGANSSLMGIANMIGPMIFAQVFATFIAHQDWHIPGAAFLLSSSLLIAGTFVVLRVTRHYASHLAAPAESAGHK